MIVYIYTCIYIIMYIYNYVYIYNHIQIYGGENPMVIPYYPGVN